MSSMFTGSARLLFSRYLLATNTFIGFTFAGLGDIVQQFAEKKLIKEKPYEPRRTGNMMAGGLCFAPVVHAWYMWLDHRFPGKKPLTLVKKLAAEMATGPPLVLAIFITVGQLEGKTVKQSCKEFKDNIKAVLMVDWGFYAPFQALNFYLVPTRYRVLYVCIISLFYNVFLSYVIYKEENKQLLKEADEKVKEIVPEQKVDG